MFFGKHQPAQAYSGQLPMGDGQMGMPGMAGMPGMPGMAGMPQVSGYAHPGFLPGAPGMLGMETAGYASPGFAETMYGIHTDFEIPCCPPVHYGYSEYEVEVGPSVQVHVVRKGETVYKIAKRYGLDWREVAGFNHLGNPSLIYPGQRLLIPTR